MVEAVSYSWLETFDNEKGANGTDKRKPSRNPVLQLGGRSPRSPREARWGHELGDRSWLPVAEDDLEVPGGAQQAPLNEYFLFS